VSEATRTDNRELHRRIGLAAFGRNYVDLDSLALALLEAGENPGASPAELWVNPGHLDRTELAEIIHLVDPERELLGGGPMATRPPRTTARSGANRSPAPPVADPQTTSDAGKSINLADVLKTHGVNAPLQLESAYDEGGEGDASPEPPKAGATGDVVSLGETDRYLIGGELGRGGVGRVVKAFDRYLGRTIAMKVPLYWPTLEDEVDKFIEEAQATGQLEHPNIVPIYDIGSLPGGEIYYTMKRVRNQSLRDVIDALARGESDVTEEYGNTRLLSIFLQVCQAMHYAHVRGVVHRDLKPDNIMLGDYGEVHVMDWGLARILDREVVTDRSLRGDARLEAGQTVGTPAYMPPEQAQGHLDKVDERSDIYSLGVILYEIMTLKQPSTRPTVMETLMAVITEPILPPSQAAPDRAPGPDMDRIIMRALEKDPRKRYRSAREFHDAVERFLDGRNEREAQRHLLEGETYVRLYEQAKGEMLRLDKRVEEIRARIRDHEPIEVKRSLWAAEDRRAETATRMVRTFGDAIRELTKALAYVPDMGNATQALARLYWSRYELAEREDDEHDQLYYLSLLRQYDDGTYVARIHDNAPVSIYTRPRKAAVFCYAYEERDRILIGGEPQYLGRAPIAEFFMRRGSYLLRLKSPGLPVVHLPLYIQRADPVGVTVHIPDRTEWRDGFVYVPRGTSIIGGDAEAVDPFELARVHIPGFFIQRHPLTFREYIEFLDDLVLRDEEEALARAPRTRDADGQLVVLGADRKFRPSGILIEGPARSLYPEGGGFEATLPVLAISFDDALAYIEWRSERDATPYRLPTELEWERAARGADGRIYPWGNHFDATFCKMAHSRDTPSQPEPVGSFPYDRSPFGVCDMAGNVREWVSSEYENDTESIVRGGYWAGDARSCRVASRRRVMRSARLANVGFRIAYTPGRSDDPVG